MPLSTNPEWPQLALYAAGAAVVLIVLFNLPKVGPAFRGLFSFALLAGTLFVLFQHAPYDPNLSRLTAQLGIDRQEVAGDEVRIPMSRDGHFWATVSLNGVERRMLVDSGATVTALSESTARAAGVERGTNLLPIVLRTANGVVRAEAGVVQQLALEGIEAQGLKVVISPTLGDVDVLGMNFLSQLQTWRVEGRTLILTPAGAGGEADPA
ncbi:retropepsin-like aspartic protease family protein [Phenylobacterium sp.]|mgnify:CR=1 FL=1|uniref:retropepsin-like aspartic protease family protein n=1 Tax=Phenylobacterium sp. TaxID=1871053 RepID=UPI002FDA374B